LIGRVERYLLDKIQEDGAIHITLIDPEKVSPESASHIAEEAEASETAAIMVGGSTSVSTSDLDKTVRAVKKGVEIPVILFPNNITGISQHADAIWFMSLLNSVDPYFIIGAQVLGAPLVKKYGLEAIPLGYIVVGAGAAVGVIGRATPIPYGRPEKEMIRLVKSTVEVPLVVGGGIKTGEQMKSVVDAGADVVVTGNVTEECMVKDKVKELVRSIKS